MAIFQRDYRRIAELHVEAGWMPDDIRIDELEAACRVGVRTLLHPAAVGDFAGRSDGQAVPHRAALRADLAAAIDPAAEDPAEHRRRRPPARSRSSTSGRWRNRCSRTILRERYSPQALLDELRKRVPELITHAPEMPRLLRDFLVQQVGGTHSLNMRSTELAELARISRDGQRQTIYAILGTGLLLAAAVMYSLDAGGPRVLGLAGVGLDRLPGRVRRLPRRLAAPLVNAVALAPAPEGAEAIRVLHQDQWLAVVDKPAGLMAHASAHGARRGRFPGRSPARAVRPPGASGASAGSRDQRLPAGGLRRRHRGRARRHLHVARGAQGLPGRVSRLAGWPDDELLLDYPLDGGPGKPEKKPALTRFVRLGRGRTGSGRARRTKPRATPCCNVRRRPDASGRSGATSSICRIT